MPFISYVYGSLLRKVEKKLLSIEKSPSCYLDVGPVSSRIFRVFAGQLYLWQEVLFQSHANNVKTRSPVWSFLEAQEIRAITADCYHI